VTARRAQAPPLLELRGVSKAYRDGAAETPVLRNVQLELGRGEITSLVGASGSGKSTLISLIAGLLVPDSGQVCFDGRDLTCLDDEARAGLRAARIGVVLQSGNLIPFLTARENVELAIGFANGRRAGRSAESLLTRLGLADRLDQPPRRLSGGEAQRASVAIALAGEPDLLLADEATGELDPATSGRVMQVIFDAARERELTVLFVTHSSELAAAAEQRLRLTGGGVEPA
jgi:ABC-type lipoprotein export system ATPase subunit